MCPGASTQSGPGVLLAHSLYGGWRVTCTLPAWRLACYSHTPCMEAGVLLAHSLYGGWRVTCTLPAWRLACYLHTPCMEAGVLLAHSLHGGLLPEAAKVLHFHQVVCS
jgi:invasion protein IalB